MRNDTEVVLRAVRGATTVETDTSQAIGTRTTELLRQMLERNRIEIGDIVSILFTATADLTADFPAVAARQIGLAATPLLCCQEIPVAGAIARCVRVMLTCYAARERVIRHVYLHEARQLRTDLPE